MASSYPRSTTSAKELLRQPLQTVARLARTDIPVEPGLYAWYRGGRLFYIGESHRSLRSRLWGNHLHGNARGSTLRNKVAKAFGFPPVGERAYGPDAERTISTKLQECQLRFARLRIELINQARTLVVNDQHRGGGALAKARWYTTSTRERVESAVSRAL